MCVHEEEFILEPNVVKVFSFSFPSLSSSVGGHIEVCPRQHSVVFTQPCEHVMSAQLGTCS